MRLSFFQLNPHWADAAKQAIEHAALFARRYAEQGDHEVSNAALAAVLEINSEYVAAKGRTFFSNQPLFDNPLAAHEFIGKALELLRQNVQTGISRGNEQQIEQTLRAMAALCANFLNIDYDAEGAPRKLALLAAYYLTEAVRAVAPAQYA